MFYCIVIENKAQIQIEDMKNIYLSEEVELWELWVVGSVACYAVYKPPNNAELRVGHFQASQ